MVNFTTNNYAIYLDHSSQFSVLLIIIPHVKKMSLTHIVLPCIYHMSVKGREYGTFL